MLEAAEWPGDVDGIVLAVHEALTNAQRHAGGATSATAAVQDSSSLLVEVREGRVDASITLSSARI